MTDKGFQVIGINFRGYGESDKSDDPNFYGTTNFSNDVINLINDLKLEKICLIRYSMGTVIALDLLHEYTDYFSKVVMIATGDGLIGMPPFIFENALSGLAKLLSYDRFPSHLQNHISAYWSCYKQIGLEKESMIAFILAKYPPLSAQKASKINIPILIISGEKDLMLGQGQNITEK